MIGDFLAQVRGLVSFEEEAGVPPRRTPFGFLMPAYPQDDLGYDLWEAQYGEKARGTTRLPIPTPRTVRSTAPRTAQPGWSPPRRGHLE